jgi:multidrug transporter EmrE-like cation transporter
VRLLYSHGVPIGRRHYDFSLDGALMDRTLTIGLAVLCVLLTTAAQISLKLGVSSRPMQALAASGGTISFLTRVLFSPMVMIGLALYVVSTVLWLLVLAKLDVSFAYPFVSLGFVFTALYAYFVIHEAMPTGRIGGIALIAMGVFFVARS